MYLPHGHSRTAGHPKIGGSEWIIEEASYVERESEDKASLSHGPSHSEPG